MAKDRGVPGWQFRMGDADRRQLKELAAATNLSQSEVIRRLVRDADQERLRAAQPSATLAGYLADREPPAA